MIKSGGVAESPKGVKAPTSDPEPSSADELVIQYFDETLTEADNINLWTWAGSCDSALPAPAGGWGADKEQLILVYCRSGNRSKQASEKLAALGYTNVVEFGGINSWPGEVEAGSE